MHGTKAITISDDTNFSYSWDNWSSMLCFFAKRESKEKNGSRCHACLDILSYKDKEIPYENESIFCEVSYLKEQKTVRHDQITLQ